MRRIPDAQSSFFKICSSPSVPARNGSRTLDIAGKQRRERRRSLSARLPVRTFERWQLGRITLAWTGPTW
eukprot:15468105-Alexandrium_andersonii.AAC.1